MPTANISYSTLAIATSSVVMETPVVIETEVFSWKQVI